MIGFGVDIGGSGVKGAIVDLDTGTLASDRHRISTPRPATPLNVIDAVRQVVTHHAWSGPLGVTVPGVVIDGVVMSAANIDHGWLGFDAQSSISDLLEIPVKVINDADAAGLA